MMPPVGVILAGGLASRMGGGDKGLLQLGNKTLLEHVVERLAPQVTNIVLNANGDPARFLTKSMPVIADSIGGYVGPLAGVLAGLDWAANIGADSVVTVAADTPFFPRNLVSCLRLAAEDMSHPLVLAATPDVKKGKVRHPTFGLWPVSLKDDLRAALTNGVRKVVIWTDRHSDRTAVFPDETAFFNVNTPADLIQAEEML